jgi:hypothetical protein
VFQAIQAGRTRGAPCRSTFPAASTVGLCSGGILRRSPCPASSSVIAALMSGMKRITTRSSAGRPSGISGFASRIRFWPASQRRNR